MHTKVTLAHPYHAGSSMEAKKAYKMLLNNHKTHHANDSLFGFFSVAQFEESGNQQHSSEKEIRNISLKDLLIG